MRVVDRLFSTRRWRWVDYAAALGAVAIVSMLIGLILKRVSIANASMLYFFAVLAVAVALGSVPAVVASVAAFLAFDFFFVEPIHALTVADPDEWIALLVFLLTAVATGQLAAGQRRRALEAEQREREAVVLYDIARLTTEPDLDRTLDTVVRRLHAELDLAALGLEIKVGPRNPYLVFIGEQEAISILRATNTERVQLVTRGYRPTMSRPSVPGPWVRIVRPHPPVTQRLRQSERLYVVPVLVRDQRVGSLLAIRREKAQYFTKSDERSLSMVAEQLGVALEREQLRQEQAQAEILRRTDELKTAMLNAVSHDLRTPLASIIASAGSLRQQDVNWSEDERREFATMIEEEAKRLDRLVGNLLDLSRIEGGSLQPEKDWYDLADLINDVVNRLRPITEQHDLTVSIPDDVPPVLLDYVEIGQVLTNLIENAAKYSPPQTGIEVCVRRVGGEIQIAVGDHGPGIPAQALPHLFEPFYRVGGRDRPPHGLGLGLAVAKGLVEAHGGRIWAEHRPAGGCFVFALPVAPDHGARLAPPTHEPTGMD